MNWAIRGHKKPDKNKQLHILSVKEYEELSETLTKYKKVFEILKDTFQLDKSKVSEETTMYFLILKDYCWEISQEEYELLEELINDESR